MQSTIPPILKDSQRGAVIAGHELGFHGMEASLEAQDVFQGVRFKHGSCFVARFSLDQILDVLFFRTPRIQMCLSSINEQELSAWPLFPPCRRS